MSAGPASQSNDVTLQAGLGSVAVDWFSGWGAVAMNGFASIGGLAQFTFRTFAWLFTRMPRKETLLPNLFEIGVLSLPVVALTGTFIGMVLAVQSYYSFRQFGFETQLGAVINVTLVRELGPVLAATMLAGRVGSRLAAQLGTMRVTEQIDALDSMGANPIQYLVVPRFLACLFVIPSLTVMADFMGVVGGYFYSVFALGIDKHHYLYNSREFVGAWDFFSGVFKSVFFGSIIAMISCYRGFTCRPGAEGVGQAATAAFVNSFVLILGSDLILNIMLNRVYDSLWPDSGSLF